MLKEFNITPLEYQTTKPYPHFFQDNILDQEYANELQTEILTIPIDCFDRYDNPFEKKYTLRDKFNCTPLLHKFITYLESEEFVNKLSIFTGFNLLIDKSRNFHGVHIYNNNDKLDIHLDAEIHPVTKEYKKITLGLYLSANWNADNGCELEIWEGDSPNIKDHKLYKCVKSIPPLFNRLILFTNSDVAWHGNPNSVKTEDNSKRIFVTVSYLVNNSNASLRQKALFIRRPQDPFDEDKEYLIKLRADPIRCKDIYNLVKI
jgi:Rps23 Pro-64 3,4-dihydroxylase Tpa1-like proline 4-hydroxylase